jgi:hypothetical protein
MLPLVNTVVFCNLSQLYLTKLGTGCKDTLVICNSIFFIFLNQIKAQRDQKIIVWVEYFPYKYSFNSATFTLQAMLLELATLPEPVEVVRPAGCLWLYGMR